MERILEEFFELVKTDCISKDERKIADWVKPKLLELGCTVEEDDAGSHFGGNTGNIFAVLEGTLPGSVLFNAHMDRDANGFGIQPRIEDGKVVSDGTTVLAADDLAGVVAILDGLRRIKASGKPHCRIEVAFSVSEEKELSGSRYFDMSKLQSKIGYCIDSPGRIGRIVAGAPSGAQLKIEVFGKAAHSGNGPEKGIDALKYAAKMVANLPTGRLDSESTANYAIFHAGGSATNVICDYACVLGETRSRNHEKLLQYIEKFEQYCQQVVEGTGAVVKTEADITYKAFNVTEDQPCIQLMKKVYDKMGLTMLVETGMGGMDANRFNEHGIQCVGLASGYFNNHSNGEHIYVEDLIRAGEMVEQIVLCYAD